MRSLALHHLMIGSDFAGLQLWHQVITLRLTEHVCDDWHLFSWSQLVRSSRTQPIMHGWHRWNKAQQCPQGWICAGVLRQPSVLYPAS